MRTASVSSLILLLLPWLIFTVKFDHALRAEAVREFRVGMFGDIGFDLLPVTVIIPDFLARSTDRKHTLGTAHPFKYRDDFGQAWLITPDILHHQR